MRICAPFAGIVRYHVSDGQHVHAGEIVATVETAKLEAPIPTPGPGTIHHSAYPNFSHVHGGDTLLEVSS